jgi:hypothetical protein
MSALGTTALVLAAAWIGALSILVALLVRQVALLTHRLDPDYALDGLPRGRRVPGSLAESLPDGSGSVLVLGAGCGPCRKLARELQELAIDHYPIVAVVEGDEAAASALAAVLPSGIRTVTGEEGNRMYSRLQLETTPFAFFVEQRQIVEKAVLRGAEHFQALLEESAASPSRNTPLRTLEVSNAG